MQRRARSRARSSARSARLFVLVIVAVTFGPRVAKCQDTAGDGSNTDIWDQRCKCNEQPKCTLSDCGNYEYCNNVGNQVSSGDDFECRQCEHGSYYKKHDVLRGYQTVKTMPENKDVWVCIDRPDEDDSDCRWVPEPIPGSETTLQACQQCPILTVANTPFLFAKDKFLKDSSFDETEDELTVPRCFASCYQAWVQGANKLESVYIPVLTADGVRYNNVNLFPEIEGDRVKNAPPLRILQSVITFFPHHEVGDWLKKEEAGWYRTYLDGNYHKKKITSLPAPRRQCQMCPVGKSMLMAPRFDEQALAIWRTKLNQLRNGLLPHSKISAKSQQSFAHEISWLNDDVLTDFDTMGICAPCPAGTYFNDANADLATTVFGSQERLNVIKKMNEGPRKANPLLAQWKLVQLRCVPCEEGTFRLDTDVGICVLAPDNAVVVLDEVDLQWQEDPGAPLKVSKTLLAQRFNTCPSGSEKASLEKTCTLAEADMGRLASSVGNVYAIVTKNDCCKPCAVNFYKVSGQAMCMNVDSNKATKVPYGSMQQHGCAFGTELKACKEKKVEDGELKFNPSLPDFCMRTEDINSEDDDWRVCLDCTAVERPHTLRLGEPRCVMCNGEGEDFKALGEFYNKETKQCESCDDCSVFEPKVQWRSFFATDEDYKKAMTPWLDKSSRIESYRVHNRWHYKHFDIKNPCKPLQRRELSWNASAKSIKIDRDDRVKVQTREKWKGQLFGEGAVAAFHAVDYERFLDGARRCAARRCETFCDMWYKYSQGCGAGAARAALWVRSADSGRAGAWHALRLEELEAQLRTLAGAGPSGASGPAADPAAELAKWKLKHHGHCVECTLCADGQYNPECNRFAEGVLPEGRCEGCTTQCEGGEFLWHKGGLRGCAPLVDELKGRVLTDYVCRRCPTWVRRAERMYAVLGCGFKETFEWWKIATFVPQYDMLLTKAQALAKAAFEHPDVEVKFKPFHHLGAYCPDGHFFNQQEKDCAFKAESGFALHHAEMSFGYEAFRLECCQLCEICDADRYRMTAQYAECTGESMLDTQAKGCGDRCESGFYVKNETELECVACTEC